MLLTRRDLLAGTGAMALSPIVQRASSILTPDAFRFVFFSDTHVGLKNNIEENRKMLAEIAKLNPEFAINGGDVTDYGWVGEYANWRTLIKDLPFKVRHIPGNHDVRWSPLGPKAFTRGTGDPMHQSFDYKGVHFVLLDSTIPLSHYGHFESAQLRWLEQDLKQTGRQTPILVFTHHWVGRDRIMVDNETELLRVLDPANVKHIFNGHGHSDLLWTWNGLANTMNKGLYQGSYAWVEVTPDKVIVSRRTSDSLAPSAVISVPIRPDRSKRPIWHVPAALSAGQTVQVFAGAKEARWGDGPWQAIEDGRLPTAGLIAGTASLSLRKDANTYLDGGTTQVHASSGVLRKRWQTKLSGGVMSHLSEVGGTIYISQMDGSLSALDSSDGRIRWSAKTEDYCHSSPLWLGPIIVVGSSDGNVYAFDQTSGKQWWKLKTDGPVYASATFAVKTVRNVGLSNITFDEMIVAGSGDGVIYGIALDGKLRWRYELPKSNTAFVQSPAVADEERVYLGAWDKNLYCLDGLTGKLVWKQDCVGERSFAYSPAIGGPCAGDGKVFVPANGNVLWAFDAKTGAKQWSVSSPGDKFGYSSPVFVDDKIVVGCLGDKGEVRCLDAKDGRILWTATTGSTIYDSGPAITDGMAFIGSVSGILSAIDLKDGSIKGQYAMPTGHFLSTPVTTSGRVYAATLSDVCMAFDIVA